MPIYATQLRTTTCDPFDGLLDYSGTIHIILNPISTIEGEVTAADIVGTALKRLVAATVPQA